MANVFIIVAAKCTESNFEYCEKHQYAMAPLCKRGAANKLLFDNRIMRIIVLVLASLIYTKDNLTYICI